jgi:hypothetical protein
MPAGAMFSRFDLALVLNEGSEALRPRIGCTEKPELLGRVFGSRVAVDAAASELLIVPEFVRHLDTAEPALPDQEAQVSRRSAGSSDGLKGSAPLASFGFIG